MRDNLENWLILHLSGLSALRFKKLRPHFDTIAALIHANDSHLRALGLSETLIQKLKNPDQTYLKKAQEFCEKPNQHILPFDHPEYPALLKEISDPPLLLYCWGNSQVFREPAFAMVGSRNPTPSGAENARHFSRELSRYFSIVSGMAIGIDGESHRGALEAEGQTIAVLGSGLWQLYPHRHRTLAQEIIIKGAVISEFPLDAPPMAAYFPQRNRIISGMSLGTLVLEATPRSGSLITARFALEQNREVFAIPGSIHAPQARGCHALLKEGAILVENIGDILQGLGHFQAKTPPLQSPEHRPALPIDANSQALLNAIGFDLVSVDQLVSRLGLSAGSITALLLGLELEGLVKPIAGGYIRVGL